MTGLFTILAIASVLAPGAAAFGPPHVRYDTPPSYHGLLPQTGASVPLPAYDVTYHGGPVQKATKSYAIYWFPKPAGSTPGYESAIDRYLADAGKSALYAAAASYSTTAAPITASSTFEGAYLDSRAFPATLNEAAVELEIEADVAKFAVTPNLNDQFFLFLPAGAPFAPPAGAPVCGLHGYTAYRGKSADTLVFAIVPYAAAPACETGATSLGAKTVNAIPGVDDAIANASREQMEMVTDPLGTGWYDETYGEIGRPCFYDYGDLEQLGGANLEVDGASHDLYVVPEIWSQAAQACRPNLPAGQSITPVPSPVYHGGPVQPSTTTYAIYWGATGTFSGAFLDDTIQFLKDVGGSAWYAVLTEYTGTYNGTKQTVANSSAYGGGYQDKTDLPSGKVDVAAIGAEIGRILAKNPSWKTGIAAQYHVFLPPAASYGGGDCGYHDSTTLPGTATQVVYEVYQYPSTSLTTGCGDDPFGFPPADGNYQASRVIATMAHEMAESVTDPIFVSGSGTGWHGSIAESEVADVCGGGDGRMVTSVAGADIVILGHGYRLPKIWSVKHAACEPNF